MARVAACLLEDVRAGLADPLAQWVTAGGYAFTRAEARVVERALAGPCRVRRFGAFRIVFRGVEISD